MGTVTSRGFLILALTLIATSSWGKTDDDCFALKAKKPTPEQKGIFFGKVRGYNSETVKTSISAMSHTCNVTLKESKRVYENLTKRGWEVINSDGNTSKDWRRAIIDVGSGRSYVAYHSKQNVLAIVFRGTGVKGDVVKLISNIVKDGQIRLIKLPWLPKKKHVSDWKALSKDRYKNWGKLKVHKGFAKEYDKFLKHVGNRVGSFLKRSPKKKPKVYCMGFSLGAALATHCAAHVKMRFGVETNLLVGASPRVGSQEFQNKYDNLIKGSLRLMLEKDPVPQVPGVVLKEKYEHVGHRLLPLFVDGKRISENHLSSITHVADNLRGKNFKEFHKSLVYKDALTKHLNTHSKSFKKGTLRKLADTERKASSKRNDKKSKKKAKKNDKKSKKKAKKNNKKSKKKAKKNDKKSKKKAKKNDQKSKKKAKKNNKKSKKKDQNNRNK